MTVYLDKKRNVWRYDFELAKHRHVGDCKDPATGAFVTSRKAALRCQEEARVAARRRPGVALTKPTGYTIAQCFADFLDSIAGTPNEPNVAAYFKELLSTEEFTPGKLVTEVMEQDFERYIAWARSQRIMIWCGGPNRERAAGLPAKQLWKPGNKLRGAGTINRYLAAAGAALGRAHRLRDPTDPQRLLLPVMPIIPYLKEPTGPARPIGDADIARIVAHCCRVRGWNGSAYVYRVHLAHAILLCRQIPFRKAEVFRAAPDDVDEELRGVWIDRHHTKAKRGEFIPAPPQAMKLLLWLKRRALRLGLDRLILYRHHSGEFRPIKDPKKAWHSVRAELGIKHTFHNTKASYSTSVAMVAAEKTTQDLSRHKHASTTGRYVLVADKIRRAAADQIGFTAPKREPGNQRGPTSQPHIESDAPRLRRVK